MQCSVSLFCLHHFNALSHPSQDDEIWIQQNLWITQLCLQMILVQLYWQVSLAGWVKYCLWMVLRFKSFKCVLCMAWVYEVGLGSLCWPAAKVTIITVMSVMTWMWQRWVFMTSSSNLDVSVHVPLPRSPSSWWHHQVTQMWCYPPAHSTSYEDSTAVHSPIN